MDDKSWLLRWVIVDTGKWLPGRQVLLPFTALASPDFEKRQFRVKLTMDQVEHSPDVSEHPSVSRQSEAALFLHYGWNPYWGGDVAPMVAVPYNPPPIPSDEPRAANEHDDPDLRSVTSITGYNIHASDGDIGHVADFLINDASWLVPAFVVDTTKWWNGTRVTLSTKSIRKIDWDAQLVTVDLTCQAIKDSPPDHHTDMPKGLLTSILSV